MKKITTALIFLTVLLILFPNANVQAQKKQNVYHNKEHAFSIILPDGWSIRSGQTPHTVVVAEDKKGASIVIQVWKLPKDVSYDQYSDQYLQQTAKESFNDLIKNSYYNAELDDYSVTYLSNRKATRIVCKYSIRNPDSSFRIKSIIFSVLGNMRMVQIICSAPVSHFKTIEKIFQRSYKSFLFEDPSWYKYK